MSDGDWLNQVPELKSGVNLTEMKLEPIDGYILSRIDGVSPVSVLADVVAMPADQLYNRLSRLSSQGAMHWKKSDLKTAAPVQKEKIDLTPDERTQIISAEKLVNSYTYWELLGVGESCDAAQLKQCWFSVSRLYHPDRFFGRALGDYQERLDLIFQQVKAAYETLQDPVSKGEYLKTHAAPNNVEESVLTRSVDEMRALSNQPNRVAENEKAYRLEARRQEIMSQDA